MRAIVHPILVARAPSALLLLGLALVVGCAKPASPVAPASPGPQAIPNLPFPPASRAYPLRHLGPSWDHGSRIAYYETGLMRVESGHEIYDDSIKGIWLLDTSTGESHLLLRGALQNVLSAWSPDGRRLVYSDHANLIVLDFESGQSIPLTTFHDPALTNDPKWSPDGSTIAFALIPAGPDSGWAGCGVWTVGADGSAPREIASGYVDPDWHPEGLVMHPPLGHGIYLWRRATNDVVLLRENADQVGDLAVSPDGSRIAISPMLQSRLWLMNADGSDPHVVADHVNWGTTWSPDGRFLVFTRFAGDEDVPANGVLWRLNVSTGELTQLTHQ
jgi:Tol biopolymer transport system component